MQPVFDKEKSQVRRIVKVMDTLRGNDYTYIGLLILDGLKWRYEFRVPKKIEGLNLPNNMKAEAARKMEQGLLQGVQLPISSIGTVTSEVTSAITATTQVTRQILNQSLSQVKVHLKANYNMYIKEETNEDRKKREEEEAEIERLYREMQMQQNEPKKKNPLTQLIEAL
jgi:biopolymer transport protein ExbD